MFVQCISSIHFNGWDETGTRYSLNMIQATKRNFQSVLFKNCEVFEKFQNVQIVSFEMVHANFELYIFLKTTFDQKSVFHKIALSCHATHQILIEFQKI